MSRRGWKGPPNTAHLCTAAPGSVNSDADAFQYTQSTRVKVKSTLLRNYSQSNFFIPPQKSLHSPLFTSDSPSQCQDSAVPRPSSFGLTFGRRQVRNTTGTDTEVCLSRTRHMRPRSKLHYKPFPSTHFPFHSLVIKTTPHNQRR